jgi:hypothetical protein
VLPNLPHDQSQALRDIPCETTIIVRTKAWIAAYWILLLRCLSFLIRAIDALNESCP